MKFAIVKEVVERAPKLEKDLLVSEGNLTGER